MTATSSTGPQELPEPNQPPPFIGTEGEIDEEGEVEMITLYSKNYESCYTKRKSSDFLLLTRDLQVNTVTVIYIAAVCVEEAFSTQTVEGLSRGDQLFPADTDAYMLLFPLDVVC